jgi:hypothetical protein
LKIAIRRYALDAYGAVAVFAARKMEELGAAEKLEAIVARARHEDCPELRAAVLCYIRTGGEHRRSESDDALRLFVAMAEHVRAWLEAESPAAEIQEGVLSKVLPTLFLIDAERVETGSAATEVRRLASVLSGVIFRPRPELDLVVWRDRTYIAMTSAAIPRLAQWIAAGERKTLFSTALSRLVELHAAMRHGEVPRETMERACLGFGDNVASVVTDEEISGDPRWSGSQLGQLETLRGSMRGDGDEIIARVIEPLIARLRARR